MLRESKALSLTTGNDRALNADDITKLIKSELRAAGRASATGSSSAISGDDATSLAEQIADIVDKKVTDKMRDMVVCMNKLEGDKKACATAPTSLYPTSTGGAWSSYSSAFNWHTHRIDQY